MSMNLNLNEWQRQLDRMQAYITELDKQARQDNPPPSMLLEAVEALHVAMEQLTANSEELHQQQIELVEAHTQAEAEQRRYRDLFEFAPDGYLVTDVHGKISEANQAICRLLGLKREMLQGSRLLTFVLPEEQPRLMDLLRRLHDGERAETWDLRMPRHNTGPFHAAVVAQPSRDERSGAVTSIRWQVRDVAEQVAQAQALRDSQAALAEANEQLEQRVAERTAELRTSEERFRVVLHGSPVTVFQQDTDLRYTWMYNPVAPYDPADVIGRTEADLLEPENVAFLTPIKRRVIDQGASFRGEVPRITDHTTYWYDMRLEPLRNPEGTIIGLTGVITDITEYHQATEAQRLLAEVSELLITSLDSDSLLQNVATKVAGRVADCCAFALPTDDDDDGLTLRAIQHHDDTRTDEVRAWLEQSLREQPEQHPFAQAMQGTRTISHTYPHDNEPVIVAVGNDNQSSQQRAPIAALLAMPLMARGQVIGVMGMLHDQPIQPVATEDVHLVGELAYRIALALDTTISYDKALHARIEAEQALRMRDQVFHLISHDLKTPLTTVHGYVYLLRRQISALDVPNKDKLLRDNDKIAATTKQMAQQIDEILQVAELQAGELPEMMRQPVDVLELARRIADAHQQISDRHTIQVSTSLDELVVKGDKTQLERVFTNLLSNAVKYSPEGSEINVTLHTEERNNTPGALAAISDQGLGIPNADLPYLFEPFRRGSNVQKHTSGTGLGLVSVRYIVEQHGGTIVVNSEEGKGSTFTIWLPQHEEP